MEKITEMPSRYRALEQKSVGYLTKHINTEDKPVAEAISLALRQLNQLIHKIEQKLKSGDRLF